MDTIMDIHNSIMDIHNHQLYNQKTPMASQSASDYVVLSQRTHNAIITSLLRRNKATI